MLINKTVGLSGPASNFNDIVVNLGLIKSVN